MKFQRLAAKKRLKSILAATDYCFNLLINSQKKVQVSTTYKRLVFCNVLFMTNILYTLLESCGRYGTGRVKISSRPYHLPNLNNLKVTAFYLAYKQNGS